MSPIRLRQRRNGWMLLLPLIFTLVATGGLLFGFGGRVPRSIAGVDTAQALGTSEGPGYKLFVPFLSGGQAPYRDDFSDPGSGWYVGPALRYNNWCYLDGDCFSRYEEVAYVSYSDFGGGKYRFYVPLTWHGGEGSVDTWFVWPVQTAPLPEYYYPLPQNFCIETVGAFVNFQGQDMQPYSAHWGIVFGANEALTTVYTAQVNANRDYAMLRYRNYVYPGNRQTSPDSDVNVEIPIRPWTGGDNPNILGTHTWNRLRVVVQGNTVRFYINGHHAGHGDITGMPRERIGLIGGSWEVTPVDIMIDYFKYEPHCTG